MAAPAGPVGTLLFPFPELNAGLNAASAAFLVAGYLFIRRRRIRAHHWCMLGAFALSVIFLASYLAYHAIAGIVRFRGAGWLRLIYLSILIPHTILAAVIVPLAIITLSFAFRSRFDRHRRWARWTLPLWLFVSVTGVIIYWLLFHF